MELSYVESVIKPLKGPPLSIIFVMGLLPRGERVGVNQLADLTKYSTVTVRKGLQKLKAMGLAEKHSRYYGWALTPKAYRLFAPPDESTPDSDSSTPDPPTSAMEEAEAKVLQLLEAHTPDFTTSHPTARKNLSIPPKTKPDSQF